MLVHSSADCSLKQLQVVSAELPESEPVPVHVVTQAQWDPLRARLVEFRKSVFHSAHERCEEMCVGLDVVCGLPSTGINSKL